jgi:methyl-accepting chemotaxis protein
MAESMNGLLDTVSVPIKETSKVMQAVAVGDLSGDIDGHYQGEFAHLADAVNTCIGNLRTTIAGIQASIGRVTGNAQEIATGNGELSRRTEDQALSLQRTASAMEQLTSTVTANAENAGQARSITEATSDRAATGSTVVGQAVSSMSGIQTSSNKHRRHHRRDRRDRLPDQPAGAERGGRGRARRRAGPRLRGGGGRGARARAAQCRRGQGDQGADQDSVAQVDGGARLVDESGNRFQAIVKDITNLSTIIAEMAGAANEQAAGLSEINSAVIGLDAITQQNTALVEEIAAASEALRNDAVEMQKQVAYFDLGTGTVAPKLARAPAGSGRDSLASYIDAAVA